MTQKYLTDAVHMDEIEKGVLNLVCAPTGSGKTRWALYVLSKTASKPYKVVYLIDTRNGKEQLLRNELTAFYDDDWRETVLHGETDWFGEAITHEKIVVMTYAKFGSLIRENASLANAFELIICDEIHNLPRFCQFTSNPSDIPLHKIARAQIERIVRAGKTTVVGISATPERAEKELNCKTKRISVDKDVRCFKTKETIPYLSPEFLLTQLSPADTGILYAAHIRKMKSLCARARELGFRAIAFWSINNTEYPMDAEQLAVREYILDHSELPPEYNLFIINASSETSINIFPHVDYIVVHTKEKETQVQVRGRYRGDLDRLYLWDSEAKIEVPQEFLDKKLFTDDKERLCETMRILKPNGTIRKWNSIQDVLIEAGYSIINGRENNRHYAIITE